MKFLNKFYLEIEESIVIKKLSQSGVFVIANGNCYVNGDDYIPVVSNATVSSKAVVWQHNPEIKWTSQNLS